MNGIPASHLSVDAPLPCDPIESLKDGKLVVSNIDQLLRAIKEIKSLSEDSRLQAMNAEKNMRSNTLVSQLKKNINVFLKKKLNEVS